MKIGMLFPGYGSQYVGMGKDLYDTSRIVQEHFEEASNCLNENFVKLCFASSDVELSKMNNAYPALFLVSVSIAELLKNRGVIPHVVAGCDTGLYSAITAVGGISVPDGLYLLNKFSQFFREFLETKQEFSSVRIKGVSRDELKKECSTVTFNVAPAFIALYYNLTDHIVAGTKNAIDALENKLAGQPEVKIKHYPQAIGLHSSYMNKVYEQFVVYLAKVDFHNVSTSLVDTVAGKLICEGQDIKKAIVSQINSALAIDKVLDHFESCDLIIEIGPGNELSTLAQERFSEKKIVTVCKKSDVDIVLDMLDLKCDSDEDGDTTV